MWMRIASGAVGIPLAVALIWAGGWWVTGAVLLLVVRGCYEFAAVLRQRGVYFPQLWGTLGAVSFVLWAHWAAPQNPKGVISLLVLLVFWGLLYLLIGGAFVLNVFRYRPGEPALANVSSTVLGVLYVGFLFSFLIWLRAWPEPPTFPHWPSWEAGARWLLLVFAVSWATDTGAYFVGRSWGRRPLAPQVSPHKTVEGSLGGWLAAVAVGWGVGALLQLPLIPALLIGAGCGVVGQLGDLAKSILKRDLGVKDFPPFIPGHGGVLDRFDSLLLNAPLVYLGLSLLSTICSW